MKNLTFLITLILFTYTNLSSQEPAKRYEIKSGMMTLTSEILGTLQDITMYFDNYGLLEYSSTTGTIFSFPINNVQIKKDGYLYAIDMNTKTCKVSKLEENTPQNINFTDITQKLIEDLSMEKTGTEVFLDKTCDKWTMSHKDMRMRGSFLVWKGISLKSEIEASGMIIRMSATSIDIDSPLPEGIFEIPEDIKIIE